MYHILHLKYFNIICNLECHICNFSLSFLKVVVQVSTILQFRICDFFRQYYFLLKVFNNSNQLLSYFVLELERYVYKLFVTHFNCMKYIIEVACDYGEQK